VTLRTQHPLEQLLSGLLVFDWVEAAAVLRGYASVIATAPDDLTVMAGVMSGPDGKPCVFLLPAWSGDLAEGESHIAALRALESPVLSQVAPMSLGDLLRILDVRPTAPGVGRVPQGPVAVGACRPVPCAT